MLVLGIQGSPRKKGNTNFLLNAFLKEIEQMGFPTQTIVVDEKNIVPCKEYITCEKKGFCPIKDDMASEVYYQLRQAEVVITASPIFFYNAPAQLKALIDRSQVLWARKYKLKMTDPARRIRKGFLLSVGATKGKRLFEGMELTAQYFCDAIGAEYEGSLTYKQIEGPGDMEKHPHVLEDVKNAVVKLMQPFSNRKTVLFACRENACRSQMASAFAQYHFGEKLNVLNAGSTPAEKINPMMIEVMKEKGMDMGFRRPQSIDEVVAREKPDIIVTMGCGEQCPFVPGATRMDWDLADPANQPVEFMRKIRDDIEMRIIEFGKTI